MLVLSVVSYMLAIYDEFSIQILDRIGVFHLKQDKLNQTEVILVSQSFRLTNTSPY